MGLRMGASTYILGQRVWMCIVHEPGPYMGRPGKTNTWGGLAHLGGGERDRRGREGRGSRVEVTEKQGR